MLKVYVEINMSCFSSIFTHLKTLQTVHVSGDDTFSVQKPTEPLVKVNGREMTERRLERVAVSTAV